MDGFGIGEFACFCGEGLGITFSDFQFPVYWRRMVRDYFLTGDHGNGDDISSSTRGFALLVLFSPPALAGTWLGNLNCLARWLSSSSVGTVSLGSRWISLAVGSGVKVSVIVCDYIPLRFPLCADGPSEAIS